MQENQQGETGFLLMIDPCSDGFEDHPVVAC